MSPTAKCEATAPRATRCVDELLIADFNEVMAQTEPEAKPRTQLPLKDSSPSASEAADIHRTNCHASESYPDAVLACWSTEPCKEFAECVVRAQRKPPIRGGRESSSEDPLIIDGHLRESTSEDSRPP